jgi:hypothetical protein
VLLNALLDTYSRCVLSLTQHPTLFLLSPLFPSSRQTHYPSPSFARSLILYLTLLPHPLAHLLLNRTLVPSLCSTCISFLPVVRSPFPFSCVKFVLYHHGFYSYVAYPYQYNWLNSFIPFLPVNLNSRIVINRFFWWSIIVSCFSVFCSLCWHRSELRLFGFYEGKLASYQETDIRYFLSPDPHGLELQVVTRHQALSAEPP